MAPLDDLRQAGERYRQAQEARDQAREVLRQALLEAVKDGIPLTVAARAAGISRQSARLLVRDS